MITQIGKQLATQIVDTVHDVCGHDINFINKNGIIYASTNTSRIGSFHEIGKKAADTKTVIEVQDNDHYEGTSSGVNIPVTHNGYLIAVIGISGSPDEVRKFAYLAEKITRLLIREQELNAACSQNIPYTYISFSIHMNMLQSSTAPSLWNNWKHSVCPCLTPSRWVSDAQRNFLSFLHLTILPGLH